MGLKSASTVVALSVQGVRWVSICEHGRQRSTCKECGGSICEHGRLCKERWVWNLRACKECGGSQICEHGRQRSRCKECGGSQICEHGRQRYSCKECRAAKAKQS